MGERPGEIDMNALANNTRGVEEKGLEGMSTETVPSVGWIAECGGYLHSRCKKVQRWVRKWYLDGTATRDSRTWTCSLRLDADQGGGGKAV